MTQTSAKKVKLSSGLQTPNYPWEYMEGINHSVQEIGNFLISRYQGEFWSSKQRQANSLHEVSYRACFKAELPNYFVQSLTKPGDIVYDPFNGRGTTVIESAL